MPRLASPVQTCAQVLLTLDNLANRSQYVNAKNTFEQLLHYGAVPIVNENDTVAVQVGGGGHGLGGAGGRLRPEEFGGGGGWGMLVSHHAQVSAGIPPAYGPL